MADQKDYEAAEGVTDQLDQPQDTAQDQVQEPQVGEQFAPGPQEEEVDIREAEGVGAAEYCGPILEYTIARDASVKEKLLAYGGPVEVFPGALGTLRSYDAARSIRISQGEVTFDKSGVFKSTPEQKEENVVPPRGPCIPRHLCPAGALGGPSHARAGPVRRPVLPTGPSRAGPMTSRIPRPVHFRGGYPPQGVQPLGGPPRGVPPRGGPSRGGPPRGGGPSRGGPPARPPWRP